MTAIVGLVHEGKVYIGGDSAGVAGYQMRIRKDHKVFINGDYIFGFTTSFRMGDLLRYSFDPPAPTKDLDRFMRTTFIDAVRECLKAGGFASKEHEAESAGTFLVGVNGRLFTVHGDYQVGESVHDFAACGSGETASLGALYALRKSSIAPSTRVREALEAAESLNAGVRGPFVVKKL